jgi:hypothetical protein
MDYAHAQLDQQAAEKESGRPVAIPFRHRAGLDY